MFYIAASLLSFPELWKEMYNLEMYKQVLLILTLHLLGYSMW